MKTTLLVLLLVLVTGLELQAQPVPRRTLRPGGANAGTNGVPGRLPGGQAPAGLPGGQPGGPGGAGGPGGPGGPGGAGAPGAPSGPMSTSYAASSAFAASDEEMIAPGEINFEGVELTQVLDIYAKLVNRTLLRGQLPDAKIILKTQTPLTKSETIQALQAVLALNNVSLVEVGDKFVKVVASEQAGGMAGQIDHNDTTNLPELGSYVTHVVQLKYVKPKAIMEVIQPFARLANGIIGLDDNNVLIIRDYAENVKRMLEMIAQVDIDVPAVYISEVIPIRYAKVDDIANALNALGSGGSGMVSIGSSQSSGQISGMGNRSSGFGSTGGTGMGGSGYGGNGNSGYGSTASSMNNRTGANGAASGSGQTFQQRLNNIIGATGGGGGGAGGSGKDQIQLFGTTKIIPNESSSSLLIYATRTDLEVIKGIILKLDVPLAQVLIEAVIMDVTLNNTFTFSASVSQNPTSLSSGGNILGGGGMLTSSSPFAGFVRTVSSVTNTTGTNGLASSVSKITSVTSTLGTNSTFGNNLSEGASYFANLGPYFDAAVSAAQTDSHASIIQRPRIQVEQAHSAQFFVGNTVPYVTGTYSGYSGYGGNSYSQLSVGVELDVTPYINPEGLVVMEIQQEIDDLNGYTAIQNVGNVPNTIKRTLNTEIAVRDQDTVMLGGFIKTDKSTAQTGVPFLSDIPILGNLFKSRSDSKDREELIVLMRPTVLNTPAMAAEQTKIEERRLPGVARAAAEDSDYERSLVEAERRREAKEFKRNTNYDGFFRADDLGTNNLKGAAGSAYGTNAAVNLDKGAEKVTAAPAVAPAVAPATPATPAPARPATNAAAMDYQARQAKAKQALMLQLLNSSTTNSPH